MIRQNLVNVILTGHENKFLVKNSKYHYEMRLKCKSLQYEGTFAFGRISNKNGFVFANSTLYCPFLNSNKDFCKYVAHGRQSCHLWTPNWPAQCTPPHSPPLAVQTPLTSIWRTHTMGWDFSKELVLWLWFLHRNKEFCKYVCQALPL